MVLITDWIQAQEECQLLRDTGVSLNPKHLTHSYSWEIIFGMDFLFNLAV